MSVEQKKNISKTIVIIVLVMVTILTLFIIKITTPRYLSNIELKINGLVLLSEPIPIPPLIEPSSSDWLLIVNDAQESALMQSIAIQVGERVEQSIRVLDRQTLSLDSDYRLPLKRIAIIKPQGQYMGYFKKPYNEHKLILTLSSVITHR